jgi:predicted GNAT family acetyltransferase
VSGAVDVRDAPQRSRFEADLDGRPAGYVTYRRSPGRITFIHTEVDDRYEGHGVGGALARYALDAARAEGLTVVPRCPFLAGWIDRHPDYADLVAAGTA